MFAVPDSSASAHSRGVPSADRSSQRSPPVPSSTTGLPAGAPSSSWAKALPARGRTRAATSTTASSASPARVTFRRRLTRAAYVAPERAPICHRLRSEEHTSELQSRGHLVCRLLLEKKKQQ